MTNHYKDKVPKEDEFDVGQIVKIVKRSSQFTNTDLVDGEFLGSVGEIKKIQGLSLARVQIWKMPPELDDVQIWQEQNRRGGIWFRLYEIAALTPLEQLAAAAE